MNTLIEKYQHIWFSRSGAAHKNGISERGIQMVIRMTCTMMIHSDMRSTQGTINAELWPVFIDHKV